MVEDPIDAVAAPVLSAGTARGGSDASGQGPPLTWFEFALRPGLLQSHLAALDERKVTQPSVEELIVAFLDQVLATKGLDATRTMSQWAADIGSDNTPLSARSTLLLKMAAQACLHSKMSFHQIETLIPARLQPALLSACAVHAPAGEVGAFKVHMARWVIRRSLGPPSWPHLQQSSSGANKPSTAGMFFSRSGTAGDPTPSQPAADERVGGIQLGAVFTTRIAEEDEGKAAADLRAALGDAASPAGAAPIPPTALAAAALEMAEWMLGRGKCDEMGSVLETAQLKISSVSDAELEAFEWQPPSTIGAPPRMGDVPASERASLPSQLRGLRLAAAAVTAARDPTAVDMSALDEAPQRLFAMAAARKRGDMKAAASIVVADMEAAEAGHPRALPKLYTRSLLTGQPGCVEEPTLSAACCISLALSTPDHLELLPLLPLLQTRRKDDTAFESLLAFVMTTLSKARAAGNSSRHRDSTTQLASLLCGWLDDPRAWEAAVRHNLCSAPDTPEASSASATETELREALHQAQTEPRPEPSGRASRAVHASLRVLNAAARGEPVAEDDSCRGDAVSARLTGKVLRGSALRCACHATSVSAACLPEVAKQARALFRAAAQFAAEDEEAHDTAAAAPNNKRARVDVGDADTEDGEMEIDAEELKDCTPEDWFEAWAEGCLLLVEPLENAAPSTRVSSLLSSAASVSTAPPALLCGILAQCVDRREWGVVDGLGQADVRALAKSERVANLVESGQLLSSFLQAHSVGSDDGADEEEDGKPGSNAVQSSADKVFAALSRVGTARSQVKEKYIGAASLELYPKGVLALRSSVATEMRSIINCLRSTAQLRVIFVALSVWLLHLVKPPASAQEPPAERFGAVAALLTPLYPPHLGLQGLGTRAASFVAAEVRAMLQAAVQRFLLLSAEDGGSPPWPEAQPCLLQLADLEFESGKHQRALELYCQVAQKIGITGLHSASIRHMADSLQALGRPLPAAAVLQTLSPPDINAAMQLLHPTTPSAALAMTRDAAFLDCLWEIRLLEVLVQRAHVLKSDNFARVKQLIQRPELNFHNPPEIRRRAIEALQSRLLSLLLGLVVGVGV